MIVNTESEKSPSHSPISKDKNNSGQCYNHPLSLQKKKNQEKLEHEQLKLAKNSSDKSSKSASLNNSLKNEGKKEILKETSEIAIQAFESITNKEPNKIDQQITEEGVPQSDVKSKMKISNNLNNFMMSRKKNQENNFNLTFKESQRDKIQSDNQSIVFNEHLSSKTLSFQNTLQNLDHKYRSKDEMTNFSSTIGQPFARKKCN